MTPDIDHALNGQNHPHLQQQSLALGAVIGNLRLLVKRSSYPVTNELPYHAKTKAFNIILDGVSNVEDPVAFLALLNPLIEALTGHIEQLLDLGLHPSDRYRTRRIPIPTLISHAKIEADDIALSQDPF